MDQALMTLVVGDIVRDPYGGRYIIEGLLGKGQAEVVYVVRDQYSMRNQYILREFTGLDECERTRLLHEGEPLQQLKRRSWPRVYGVFEDGELRGRVYLLMDYIPGMSLVDICRTAPFFQSNQGRMFVGAIPCGRPPMPSHAVLDQLQTRAGDHKGSPLQTSRFSRQKSSGRSVRRAAGGTKRRERLLFLALALLVGAIVGVSFLTFLLRPQQAAARLPRPAATVPRAIPSPTAPQQPPSIYPTLAAAYAGTVLDLLNNEKTAMYFTGIQQNQEKLSGLFEGLGLAGPVSGTVTTTGHVRFTMNVPSNSITLVFDGDIKIGGDITGSFVVLNQHGEKTGESGIWNMAANP